jgi:hypothetical protein
MLASAAGTATRAITATNSSGIITIGISRTWMLRRKALSRNSATTLPARRGAADGRAGCSGRPRYFDASSCSRLASRTSVEVMSGLAQPNSTMMGITASSETPMKNRVSRYLQAGHPRRRIFRSIVKPFRCRQHRS